MTKPAEDAIYCSEGGRCRADWIRTSDPHVPNVVRYRAALLPENDLSIKLWCAIPTLTSFGRDLEMQMLIPRIAISTAGLRYCPKETKIIEVI